VKRPAFTLGVEEEYLVVDRETRDLVRDPPPEMLAECEKILGTRVSPEFLRSQIEVGTGVCKTIQDARGELAEMRGAISQVAGRFDYAIIGASTHPFARWWKQQVTDRERYNIIARDMQTVMRRLVICGMHVHVGIEDADLRIDLMNQVSYFLPHLLALSTSSPFWHGNNTGLKSYRKSVFKAAPRTGVPMHFYSWGEYMRHVNVLVKAGVLEDATKLWWDIRPSARYPTLEMRIADLCTRLDDAITVAAMYVCLLSMLYRKRLENQRWRQYAAFLIEENIWRAQRYGVRGSLVDFGKGELVEYQSLLEEMMALVRQDADFLGCTAEIENARTILKRGTSADRQLETFKAAKDGGAEDREALNAVVDLIIEETMIGV